MFTVPLASIRFRGPTSHWAILCISIFIFSITRLAARACHGACSCFGNRASSTPCSFITHYTTSYLTTAILQPNTLNECTPSTPYRYLQHLLQPLVLPYEVSKNFSTHPLLSLNSDFFPGCFNFSISSVCFSSPSFAVVVSFNYEETLWREST